MLAIRDALRGLTGRIIVVVMTVAVFVGAAHFVYLGISGQMGRAQAKDLSRTLLHRVELAADYAVIALGDLAQKGLDQCDGRSLLGVRKSILQHGAIKDILVLSSDGQVLCSGMPRSLGLNVVSLDLTNGFPAQNGSIVFHNVGRGNYDLIGIAWKFGTRTLFTVLNVDALLFDTMPAHLRDDTQILLGLGEKTVFATNGDTIQTQPGVAPVSFIARSDRYPLYAELRIPQAVLAQGIIQLEMESLIAAGLVGLAFGLLLAQLAARPPDPRTEMRQALARGEFQPYLQPIFSLADRSITGCEVLVRWVKPDGSILAPIKFIPLAEDSGLIVPMTRSLIRTTLVELAEVLWHLPYFTVAFNITPSDLCSAGFAEDILALISHSAARPRQIVLELTEREAIPDREAAQAAIRTLKAAGISFALDDTGTGHNGLSYVQDLDVDIIKIDKKFVDLADSTGEGTQIVEMLVHLARRMGMTTVAEGIETEAQAKILGALSVDKGQGYLMSPPVAPDAFRALLEENARKRSGSRRHRPVARKIA